MRPRAINIPQWNHGNWMYLYIFLTCFCVWAFAITECCGSGGGGGKTFSYPWERTWKVSWPSRADKAWKQSPFHRSQEVSLSFCFGFFFLFSDPLFYVMTWVIWPLGGSTKSIKAAASMIRKGGHALSLGGFKSLSSFGLKKAIQFMLLRCVYNELFECSLFLCHNK